MRAVDVIAKKRDGMALSREEIAWFVREYTADTLPDYQASAWLMAVYLQGMNDSETSWLTEAMMQSGEVLDLSDVTDFALDKHSCGGVGDKTTLVVLPMVAACGVPVGKMSGRGLSFTGGTLDKIESISGFNVSLTVEQFKRQIREEGIALCGQTGDLAPADGKLYALRDVTATVANRSLIAASIMAKKLAAGANGIVLDVKVGEGAFMRTLEDARDLARLMVDLGVRAGRKVTALIGDMDQPLGEMVGNALEVQESIMTLHDEGPLDFREHCLVVADHMLRLAGRDAMREKLESTLADGSALEKFRAMVAAQGGDLAQVDDPGKLPAAPHIDTIGAPRGGHVESLNAREVGMVVVELGGGRAKKGDPIDHSVGVRVHVKVGDKVESGAPLFTVHARSADDFRAAKDRLINAVSFSDEEVAPLPLFYDTITGG